MEVIHSSSATEQDWGRGFILLPPQAGVLADQMLAVIVLSQHRVSSSKTVSPRIPLGARCVGHTRITCSAVCSTAPHSQFGVGARPHLCMDDLKQPTPVRRRLSLTQAVLDKPIPIGRVLVLRMRARRAEALSEYSAFHV